MVQPNHQVIDGFFHYQPSMNMWGTSFLGNPHLWLVEMVGMVGLVGMFGIH